MVADSAQTVVNHRAIKLIHSSFSATGTNIKLMYSSVPAARRYLLKWSRHGYSFYFLVLTLFGVSGLPKACRPISIYRRTTLITQEGTSGIVEA